MPTYFASIQFFGVKRDDIHFSLVISFKTVDRINSGAKEGFLSYMALLRGIALCVPITQDLAYLFESWAGEI